MQQQRVPNFPGHPLRVLATEPMFFSLLDLFLVEYFRRCHQYLVVIAEIRIDSPTVQLNFVVVYGYLKRRGPL